MATIEQLQQALINADKAGDTAAATALAQALKQANAAAGQVASPRGDKLVDVPSNVPQVDPPDALDNGLQILGIPHTNGAARSALGGAVDALSLGFGDEAAAGVTHLLTGMPYDQALGQYRGMLESSQQSHPWAFVGGQVAGAAPTLVLPGMAPVRGASLLENGARMAAAGGVANGLYGFGSGDSLNDRAAGAGYDALIGAGLGAGVPLAGRGVSAGVRAVANAMSGAPDRAVALLGRAAADDRLTPNDAALRLYGYGPQSMPADLGPNLQRQAGAIASLPGEGQQIVRDAIVNRQQGANARITRDLDATLGPAPIPSAVDAGIVANQRALGPAYDAVFANSRAVDTGRLALNLDAQTVNARGPAQKAAQTIRKMLNVTGTDQLDPNPRTLFETRNAIDGMLATEQDPKAHAFLTGARRQVDDLLTQAVPGIKDVDAQYAELARQRDALTRGQQVLDSGRTAPRPAELADEVAQSALPQGTAVGPSAVPLRLSQGARAEIDRIVGTKTNDVVALQSLIKGDGSWNRDRLATLFGPDRADRIIQVLDREKAFADTTQVVTRNSETAARLAAQGEVAPAVSNGTAGVVRSILNLKGGDAAARAASWFTGGVNNARRNAANVELARMLVGQTPQAKSAAVQAIADAITRRNKQLAVEQGINYALLPVARGSALALTPR